jgi:predicted GNAT family N-acyltransferase
MSSPPGPSAAVAGAGNRAADRAGTAGDRKLDLLVLRGNDGDARHLRSIRAWANTDRSARATIRAVVPVPTLEALGQLGSTQRPAVVACLGWSPSTLVASDVKWGQWRRAIAVPPPTYSGPFHETSAATFEHGALVVVRDVTAALRKEVVRWRNQDLTVRELVSIDDLRLSFALRYAIWMSEGYVPAARNAARARLELDYTDRTAVAVGAFTADGRLAGCARLVRQLGAEVPAQVARIEAIVRDAGDPVLRRNFAYPPTLVHPFDLLEAFRGFRAYYHQLVVRKLEKGEISRVIVDPEWRGHHLGEVLVDRLVEIARHQHVHMLFLACRAAIQPFYEASGFRRIPGLTADRFGDIPVPSILMERTV